jgi:hypothetical protein
LPWPMRLLAGRLKATMAFSHDGRAGMTVVRNDRRVISTLASLAE